MKEIPLEKIDHVLLDLDGTLLDKYFDDYFWLRLVPERYAQRHGISLEQANKHLISTYGRHEGTLNWTDLEFWSRELELDIPALKEQLRHLIEVHPHVEDFLRAMRAQGKVVALLTNAHSISVKLKFRETGIGKYFDHVLTSAQMGYPKEDIEFWERAQGLLGFRNESSLFIDDTPAVLKTAREFGIGYVLLKGRSSSREEPQVSAEFPYITDFNELLKDA